MVARNGLATIALGLVCREDVQLEQAGTSLRVTLTTMRRIWRLLLLLLPPRLGKVSFPPTFVVVDKALYSFVCFN